MQLRLKVALLGVLVALNAALLLPRILIADNNEGWPCGSVPSTSCVCGERLDPGHTGEWGCVTYNEPVEEACYSQGECE